MAPPWSKPSAMSAAPGTLLRNLEKKLRACGVTLSPVPPTEVFATLEEQGWIDPFMSLVATFLKHFKGAPGYRTNRQSNGPRI